jgi:hypothetical protein
MKLLVCGGTKYEKISSGGRVRMQSNEPVAIAVIHDFLRFSDFPTPDGQSLG